MNLLLRADATPKMGTGHVMRCLALAQAWQDEGGQAVFITAQMNPEIAGRIRSEKMQVARVSAVSGSAGDAAETAELAARHSARWIVIDGYQFHGDFQRVLRQNGRKILVIDDTAECAEYFADIVLNQNIHVHKDAYKNCAGSHLLLGPRYAMLRREFRGWRAWQRVIEPTGRKILVTMGGSDPPNFTAVVIQALEEFKVAGLEVKIVIGGANPHQRALEEQLRRTPRNLCLLKDATDMAELMAWADVAVSAAGSTSWEMCLLGLPAILVDLAANQRPIAKGLAAEGAAIHLGSSHEVTPDALCEKLERLLSSHEHRSTLSSRARMLVDGCGAKRVIVAMRGGIHLRLATEDDCRLLWEWANDPVVRSASFSSNPIPWDEHVQWFRRKVNEPGAFLFIATGEDHSPVGQVRLEGTHNGIAEIGISIAASKRGMGLASRMIEQALNYVFARSSVTRVDAFVKPENASSQRAFETAGFRHLETTPRKGSLALHYVRERTTQ